MKQMLQQAIVATRAGNTKEAQILLAEVLKENPNEIQAWYLLSLLVESESKQEAYLQKVISLDPNHAKAQDLLSQRKVVPEPSTNELITEEEQDFPLPDIFSDSLVGEKEAVESEELPDWLKESTEPAWIDEQPTLVSEPKEQNQSDSSLSQKETSAETSDLAPAQSSKPTTQTTTTIKPTTPQTKPYSTLLTTLIIGAAIILLLLIYFIFTS
ncbi:MAG: hypothetical protein GY943_34340 [Chloroflexi bacterium]|nr:hypothetical protein [Chloroflexota bacterium]